MPNLQIRRAASLMILTSLVLGVLTLASSGAAAAQTATDTATAAASPVEATTAAATVTPAAPAATPAIGATVPVTSSASPTATVQNQSSVWSAPVNLSQSGAASAPAIAAEPNGNLNVLWWDKFAGTQYDFYTPAKGWSKPVSVSSIIGSRPSATSPQPGAPAQLHLLVDNSHELYAFWIDAKGNLLFAQSRSGITNSWTGGLQLATSPLDWNVVLDQAGSLHLAFIRPSNDPLLPSGVYYRLSSSGGQVWNNALAIDQSPYFRTLDATGAHVNVASNGSGAVIVAWDDPQLKRSFFAQSENGGRTFSAPARMEAADALQSDSVQRVRFFPLSSGQFLRLWQAGDNCVIYQQQSDDQVKTWSEPVRVFQNLGGCPSDMQAVSMPENQMFMTIAVAQNSTGLLIALWDGNGWAPPEAPLVSFVNPLTNSSTSLGCLDPTLSASLVVLVGCDDNHDIWATNSLNDLTTLLPALNTAWSPPTIVAGLDGDANLPAVAAESDTRMHVLWSQISPDSGPAGQLDYMRGDGENWTPPDAVLASPHGGKAEAPTLLVDQAGSLHALWSGGFAGEVYYSQSFIRDAATASGWSNPTLLPAPLQAGSAPAAAVDSSGVVHVLYAIPLNESRGVYYTRSDDHGVTWSAYKEIFNAAGAGWPMVTGAQLVIDSANRLQAIWVEGSLPPSTTFLGIYYSRSVDGGQTWSPPVQISGVDTGYPVLSASGPDEIHLLWSADLSGQSQLWHQWSTDGGTTWSKSTPLVGLHNIAPSADLATDGAGGLYLVGVEQTADSSAALFYLRWDGNVWTDAETLPLGYTADSSSGARAIILPDGRLGVFYRVRAPTGNGSGHYVLGYAQRPVQASVATPQPTLTPPPTVTAAASGTPPPTLTASPTPDLNTANARPVSQQDMLRIGAVLIGMLVVVVVAMIGLRLGQR